MYIPLLAKQKTNAWQLAVLPCVFGMLFYFAGQYSFGHRLASIALLSAAVTLMAFLLAGGLRACAIGLDLYIAFMTAQLVYYYLHPTDYLIYDISIEVIAAAFSACLPVNLIRVLLPRKLLGSYAKANFKSFFWIAGVGIFLFVCMSMSILMLDHLRK